MGAQITLPHEWVRRLARAVMNMSGDGAGLAEGTAAATIQTANAVAYRVNGVHKTKAATDNIAIASWDATNEPLKALNVPGTTAEKCLFLILVDAAGAVKVRQSAIVAAAAADPDLPAVPDGYSPFGSLKVQTDAATPFTPATTDLGAAGITDTYTDFCWPQTGDDAFDLTVVGS